MGHSERPGHSESIGQPEAPAVPTRKGRAGPVDDRLTAAIAVVITVVSILIALTAWRTSEASNLAADLDSLAIQQQARLEEEEAHLSGLVEADLRLLPTFAEHVLEAHLLAADAAAARDSNAVLATRLSLEAQGRQALARAIRPFFRGAIPQTDPDGRTQYDPAFVLRNLREGSTRLVDLRPDETQERAGLAKSRTSALVFLVIVFAGCLLLLTLAQIGVGRLRVGLAAAGAIGALSGVVLLLAVELVLATGIER